jgi:hypothetical protein
MIMKQKIQNLIKYLIFFTLLLAPALVLAQTTNCSPNCVQQGLYPLSGMFGTGNISDATSLSQLLPMIIELLLGIAGGVAVIFVIIGGYQYITSGGNEESAEKGRKTLTNAVIGIVIIVLSYAIITVIANLVSTPGGYGYKTENRLEV